MATKPMMATAEAMLLFQECLGSDHPLPLPCLIQPCIHSCLLQAYIPPNFAPNPIPLSTALSKENTLHTKGNASAQCVSGYPAVGDMPSAAQQANMASHLSQELCDHPLGPSERQMPGPTGVGQVCQMHQHLEHEAALLRTGPGGEVWHSCDSIVKAL